MSEWCRNHAMAAPMPLVLVLALVLMLAFAACSTLTGKAQYWEAMVTRASRRPCPFADMQRGLRCRPSGLEGPKWKGQVGKSQIGVTDDL